MVNVYLLLGSNLGNRNEILASARERINAEIGAIENLSAVYSSPPWGYSSSYAFLNQVVLIKTSYNPVRLLEIIKDLEKEAGRIKKAGGYSDRLLDIDILFYGNEIIDSENLKIPHPGLHLRRFTLVPLNEIAPGLIHPVLGKPVSQLLGSCEDTDPVEVFTGEG